MEKTSLKVLASALLVCAFTGSAKAQWLDTFDGYQDGPLAQQSDWEEEFSGAFTDPSVTAAFAFSGTKSVKLVLGDAVVYPFSKLPSGRPASGQWLLSLKTYVPSGETGVSGLGLFNIYQDPGAGPDNVSVGVGFDASNNLVQSLGPGHEKALLIRDRWVSLRVYIDLGGDKVEIFYGNELLVHQASWKDGGSGGGIGRIDVLELFGGDAASGSTGIYVDHVSLTPADNHPVVLDTSPNPAVVNDIVHFATLAPTLPLHQAALFAWDVSGIPTIMLLATDAIGPGGSWSLFGQVPPGIGALDVNFVSFVVGPNGGLVESNKDLVYLR